MSEPLSLEAVLRELSKRKICCGILTTTSNRALVWLAFNGRVVEGAEHTLSFRSDTPDQVARWLMDAADCLFSPAPEPVHPEPAHGDGRRR